MSKGISVFGLGKVGLTLTGCLARAGHQVVGVDVNSKIVAALNDGSLEVSETGVQDRLQSAKPGQVKATTNAAEAIANTDLSFVIVPTASNTLGGFSNRHVLSACKSIGRALRDTKSDHIVAIVSTMMPGSSEGQIIPTLEKESGRRVGKGLGYAYNPSFIALGEIVKGIETPDYVLVGQTDEATGDKIIAVHRTMVSGNAPPIARMTPVEAEIAKIASNTHETMRVSFANMLLSICAEVPGANVDRITEALSHRMGKRFFKGALPYGGPCWPRDNVALSAFMDMIGAPSALPRTVDAANADHGRYVLRKILAIAPPGARVGIIGLAYKPGTQHIDCSYSIDLVRWLRSEHRSVNVWDPEAAELARQELGSAATFCKTAEECLSSSDVVVIALPLTALRTIDWSTGKRATVLDCWRAMSVGAQSAVGKYLPLGVGGKEEISQWLGRIAGARFDLLTN
ncbi:MAG TPA: nucleotide sugar dehydrogenase [Reyranella sp.]|jgi:UDPglucose 6-dehydrogenase|nr:nucleotide sugar dehydrogenase [Reyranella sp.]